MNFILLPAGSKGFSVEGLLAKLFPPKLSSLDRDSLKDTLAYQYRITRRGVDRDPYALTGMRIVCVRQWRNEGHKSRALAEMLA